MNGSHHGSNVHFLVIIMTDGRNLVQKARAMTAQNACNKYFITWVLLQYRIFLIYILFFLLI